MGWFGDDLPRSSSDIELLEGSPSSLRSCASDLRTLAGELTPAWLACHQLGLITDGTSWNGQGFDAFRTKVEKNPKTSDIDNAQSMMSSAAGALDTLATGLDDCQGRITWCRQRIDALALGDGDIPDDVRPQVESIKADADGARADYARYLTTAGQTFDELTDKTVYAEPPPGFFESVGNFFEAVGSISADFLVGIVEGVWEMVKGLWAIGDLLIHPDRWPAAWETIKKIAVYAWNNPLEFGKMVGLAMVDWETLKENPAKWLGKLVPNILLAIVTGGAGTAASVLSRVGAFAARFSRLARVADKMSDVARVASKVDKIGRADHLARKVGLLKPLTKRAYFKGITAQGKVGDALSLKKWTGKGYRPVAQQVTLHSKTAVKPNGKPVEAIADHFFADDANGGKLFGVEAKNGLGAGLRPGQKIVYPEMRNTGVEVRGDKLAGEGVPSGSTVQGDMHVDNWYSPHDAPKVVTQVAVQTGVQIDKSIGDDRFHLPAST